MAFSCAATSLCRPCKQWTASARYVLLTRRDVSVTQLLRGWVHPYIYETPCNNRDFCLVFLVAHSAKKTPGGTARRPPLSSILDNKPAFASPNLGDEGLFSPTATPGPSYAGSEYGADSARKFPLVSADSLRQEFTNPSTGRLGLTGSVSQSGFGSPTPARPPLRSVLDGYADRTSANAFDTRTPSRATTGGFGAGYSATTGREGDREAEEQAQRAAARMTSPVLTLAPYQPAGSVLVSYASSLVCVL